jgi:hypothetical protein
MLSSFFGMLVQFGRGAQPRKAHHGSSARSLGLEPLEQRTLLTVSTVAEAFKTITFSLSGTYSGTVDQASTPDYHDAYSGTFTETGSLVYTSPTAGTGSFAGSASGSGSDTLGNYTFQATGHGTLSDNAGSLVRNNVTRDTFSRVPTPRPFGYDVGGATPYDESLSGTLNISAYPFVFTTSWNDTFGSPSTHSQGSATASINDTAAGAFDIAMNSASWITN